MIFQLLLFVHICEGALFPYQHGSQNYSQQITSGAGSGGVNRLGYNGNSGAWITTPATVNNGVTNNNRTYFAGQSYPSNSFRGGNNQTSVSSYYNNNNNNNYYRGPYNGGGQITNSNITWNRPYNNTRNAAVVDGQRFNAGRTSFSPVGRYTTPRYHPISSTSSMYRGMANNNNTAFHNPYPYGRTSDNRVRYTQVVQSTTSRYRGASTNYQPRGTYSNNNYQNGRNNSYIINSMNNMAGNTGYNVDQFQYDHTNGLAIPTNRTTINSVNITSPTSKKGKKFWDVPESCPEGTSFTQSGCFSYFDLNLKNRRGNATTSSGRNSTVTNYQRFG